MSAQGDLPDRADFGLIETLRWTAGEGFFLLDEHIARLGASAASLGFACDRDGVIAGLEGAVTAAVAPRLRVRLVLARDGSVTMSAQPLELQAADTTWRVALARSRFASDNPLLRHKTTRRDLYESELARAVAHGAADEVIFLNERDEVCEGARANVFILSGGILLTPPVASGLLPGTLRARLLAEGRSRENVLRVSDLAADADWFMGNSVRGLVRARLV